MPHSVASDTTLDNCRQIVESLIDPGSGTNGRLVICDLRKLVTLPRNALLFLLQGQVFESVLTFVACTGFGTINAAISIDLAPLHPGSILSGSLTLQNPLVLGDFAQIPLSFTDPSDYSPNILTTTLSVTAGTPTDQFRFSTITFTNLADNKTYNLMVRGAAQRAVDFPCTSTGGYEANSPPAFSGTYTITAAPAAVPEPSYALLVLGLVTTFAFGRRLLAWKNAPVSKQAKAPILRCASTLFRRRR